MSSAIQPTRASFLRGRIVRDTLREFSDDGCATMAASLAYYTIFSLAPLLVIVIAVASFFWDGARVQERIVAELGGVVGDAGVEQVTAMLDAAQKGNRGLWATVVGVGILLFGATGVMVQLQSALNKVFEVKPDPQQGGVRRFIVKRLLSFGMILTVAFLLIVSLVLTTVLSALSERLAGLMSDAASNALLMAADFGVSLMVFTALFSAMFKWLPDVRLRWRDVLIAGGATAVLFLAGKFGLGIYLGRQDPSAYGPAAALVLILIWVYYSGMIFLFGAEFAQVWSQRGGRRLEPEPGAIRENAGQSR